MDFDQLTVGMTVLVCDDGWDGLAPDELMQSDLINDCTAIATVAELDEDDDLDVRVTFRLSDGESYTTWTRSDCLSPYVIMTARDKLSARLVKMYNS